MFSLSFWKKVLVQKPIEIIGLEHQEQTVVADQSLYGWIVEVDKNRLLTMISRPTYVVTGDTKKRVKLRAAERIDDTRFRICFHSVEETCR